MSEQASAAEVQVAAEADAVEMSTAEAAKHRGKYVPIERFNEVLQMSKEALSQAATLERERDQFKQQAEQAGGVTAEEVEELRAQLEAEKARASWADSAVHLAREGFADERVMRIIRAEFEGRAAGEDGERPDWSSWWEQQSGDYTHLFGHLKAGASNGTSAAPAPKPKPPRADAKASEVDAEPYSAEHLLSMSNEERIANLDAIKAKVLG